VDKFLEMFHVKIDPTKVLKEYYSLQDFLLRFRAVQAMLDTTPVSRCVRLRGLERSRMDFEPEQSESERKRETRERGKKLFLEKIE
jgi:hypothetical protein